jgi:hypothetical protein
LDWRADAFGGKDKILPETAFAYVGFPVTTGKSILNIGELIWAAKGCLEMRKKHTGKQQMKRHIK